jgi:hypothetical protein
MKIARRTLAALFIGVFISAMCVAQTSAGSKEISDRNADDSMKGWKPVCIKPACNPGGQGTPSATSQTIGHRNPTKDGHSMKVSITGPKYSNALWTHDAGAYDNATSFTLSLWVYPTGQASVAGSFEYDLFDFSKSTGIEFMWGSQCNQVNGLWQVFDQLGGQWMNTAVRCSLSPNRWHHIQWDVHRVAGDTNRCSGKPCMYYDTLTVDNDVHPVNAKYPAGPLPGGWSSVVGFQVQIDIGLTGSPVTVDEYIDLADFTAM